MRSAIVIALVSLVSIVAIQSPGYGLPRGTKVEQYRTGLDFPVDMAWVPGTKRVFITEKSGAIRMIKGGRLLSRSCVNLPVNDSGERGALGLALHPKYKKNHRLFVFYTNSDPLENRVSRFVVRNDRCTREKVVVGGLPASSSIHHGGQLEFMGGKLFITTGDAGSTANSQNTSDRAGKVLRYNANGSVPGGNPFDNPVWSYGHRNAFGMDHKPGSNKLFISENGPSCDDELNRIKPGRNYGWGPNYSCGSDGVGPDPKPPAWRWSSVIAPTDLTWYTGKLKSLAGTLYMGDYLNGRLYRFVMNKRDNKPKAVRTIHDTGAPIFDVSEGPGGWFYFLTPNSIDRIVKE